MYQNIESRDKNPTCFSWINFGRAAITFGVYGVLNAGERDCITMNRGQHVLHDSHSKFIMNIIIKYKLLLSLCKCHCNSCRKRNEQNDEGNKMKHEKMQNSENRLITAPSIVMLKIFTIHDSFYVYVCLNEEKSQASDKGYLRKQRKGLLIFY